MLMLSNFRYESWPLKINEKCVLHLRFVATTKNPIFQTYLPTWSWHHALWFQFERINMNFYTREKFLYLNTYEDTYEYNKKACRKNTHKLLINRRDYQSKAICVSINESKSSSKFFSLLPRCVTRMKLQNRNKYSAERDHNNCRLQTHKHKSFTIFLNENDPM